MDAPRLRPYSHLLLRGVGAAIAFFVPTFGVLYFLTIPDGPWAAVLIAQVVVMAGFAFALIAYARLGVWVTSDTIAERGFFGVRQRYELSQLGSMVLVSTYHGGWIETLPQLFVCDPEGRQLIRLRGQFWSSETMHTVMEALDVPITEIDRPVSTSELHAMHPGLLYWFERRPVVAALIFAGVLVGCCALLYVLLVALGETI